MKTTERPIFFSTPMVTAIQEGRKTQTRRVVKDPLDTKGGQFCVEYANTDPNVLVHVHNPKCEGYCDYTCHYPCPYGQIGDHLWVKETFFAFGYWQRNEIRWSFVDYTLSSGHNYYYADTEPTEYGQYRERNSGMLQWWKRPSIFMPRIASRITVEITDVRVQRLQEISEEDAIAEGVVNHAVGCCETNVKTIFRYIWDFLNTKNGYVWGTNPWVWAISFKVVPPCPNS